MSISINDNDWGCEAANEGSKLNKAYLKKLDRKFDRLFKKGHGRLTNTSKSVYSFEGEVLSEEDDEYNSDSSFETKSKIAKVEYDPIECRHDQLSVTSGCSIQEYQDWCRFENSLAHTQKKKVSFDLDSSHSSE